MTDVIYMINNTQTIDVPVELYFDFNVNRVTILERNKKYYLGIWIWIGMDSRNLLSGYIDDVKVVDSNAMKVVISFFKNKFDITIDDPSLLSLIDDKDGLSLEMKTSLHGVWYEVTDKELYKKISEKITTKYIGHYEYYIVYDVSSKTYTIERSYLRDYRPIDYVMSPETIDFYHVTERDKIKSIHSRNVAIPTNYDSKQVEKEIRKALTILKNYTSDKALFWGSVSSVLDNKKDEPIVVNISNKKQTY